MGLMMYGSLSEELTRRQYHQYHRSRVVDYYLASLQRKKMTGSNSTMRGLRVGGNGGGGKLMPRRVPVLKLHSWSSGATAHGESLLLDLEISRMSRHSGNQYMTKQVEALAGLATQSMVDFRKNKRTMPSHSSEDSGFLDEAETVSHISSCSNLSSMDHGTPAGGRSRGWWKTMSKTDSSSSLGSRLSNSQNHLDVKKNCDYFKSELTGKVLSFRSSANRRSIRHLPEAKQTVILMGALENFLFCKFRVPGMGEGMVNKWLRDTDTCLLQQGWQECPFVSEQALIFMYLLASDNSPGSEVLHIRDLKKLILTWVFIAYSYIGMEITYPISNFLNGESVDSFIRRCLFVSLHNSSLMLLLSQNRSYEASIYEGLLSYAQF